MATNQRQRTSGAATRAFACIVFCILPFALVIPTVMAQEEPKVTITTPQLGTPIPGLDLSNLPVGNKGGYLYVPWIPAYVAAAYKYMIGASLIAAAVMLVFGGFQYIWGSSLGSLESGKKKIFDAIIGLILILGANTILQTLNPSTATLSPVEVKYVEGEPWIEEAATGTIAALQTRAPAKPVITGSTPPPADDEHAEPGEAKAYEKVGTETKPATSIAIPSGTLPTKEEMLPYVVAQARAYEIHPCYAIATIQQESKWKLNAIGHDENFNYPGVLINSRLKFLRSGVKKSKETFSSDVPNDCKKAPQTATDEEKKQKEEIRKQCVDAAKSRIFNDDKVTNEPPDYGLDWRFSHGIGLGQATIFPRTPRCPNGDRGITYLGRCFTPPELVSVEGGVDATLRELKQAGAKKDPDPKEYSGARVFRNYIGGSLSDRAVVMRDAAFLGCLRSHEYDWPATAP